LKKKSKFFIFLPRNHVGKQRYNDEQHYQRNYICPGGKRFYVTGLFNAYLFGFWGFYGRSGGIAAHGAAVLEHFIRAGIIAFWAADGSKKTATIRAGFYVASNLITAIITKKTWFLFQFYADLVSGLTFSEEPLEVSLAAGLESAEEATSVFLDTAGLFSDLPPLLLSVT